MIRLFFLLTTAIILETVFYGYPFTLLVVILAALATGRRSLTVAFSAGVILDLFSLRPLGVDSIIFLGVCAFILRYNRRIHFSNIVYVMIFIFITVISYSLYFYQAQLNAVTFVLTAVLGVILLLFLPQIFPLELSGHKLKV